MKITYIYHSSFLVELQEYILLFDYYKGELPFLDPNKHLLVFVSHNHDDHYSSHIWTLHKLHPNVSYILDQDVEVMEETSFLQVHPNQVYDAYGIKISTFASTDEGCAFLLEVEEKTIYHAGDLNWWHWEGEVDHINTWHKHAYLKEIEKLRNYTIDVGFIPFDPRQGIATTWGIQALLSICHINHVFPMHFQHNICAMQRYWKDFMLQEHPSKRYTIQTEGEQFILSSQ